MISYENILRFEYFWFFIFFLVHLSIIFYFENKKKRYSFSLEGGGDIFQAPIPNIKRFPFQFFLFNFLFSSCFLFLVSTL